MAEQDIPVITVDGPSGTGKGTVCAYLARDLGWHLLDSGALYRVLALAAQRAGVDLQAALDLAALVEEMSLEFKQIDDGINVFLGGEDVSSAIRSESCGSAASLVAAHPQVREALLVRQRQFRQAPGLIADGRDMGTVVFPDARLKIFLSASPDQRAQRRYKQLKEKGISANLRGLSADIAERDRRDKERVVSPLKPAEDAILIDTTDYGIDEVNQQISKLVLDCFPDL